MTYADSLTYNLPDAHLLAFSEVVTIQDTQLSRDKDYVIDYKNGTLRFTKDTFKVGEYWISYLVTPDFLLQNYLNYKMQTEKDSLLTILSNPSNHFLFQGNDKLIISGSKTLSLTLSNASDYSLNQSLYLSLKGELSHNFNIEGKLSDSETHFTPEGDTHELSNLDQVYLKLYGKYFSILLGNQEHSLDKMQLINYNTRFEGINAEYLGKVYLQAAVAVNGGKPNINIIQGLDGKQGPYYLTISDSGQRAQIVAGSEKISLNGNPMERGADYTIDYSEGSLVFKKLITSSSRIFAEFLYTDDYYRQNLYTSSSEIAISPNIFIGHSLISQSDDKNNPLLWSFSASDKDSLRNAGDKIVFGQGIFQVEPGSGTYIQKTDTDGNVYYEYAPSDSAAAYLVYFSYMGFGLGDYEPIGSGKYQYKGKFQGSYMPVKKLIPSTSKTNFGVYADFKASDFSIDFQTVLTYLDQNTFSSKDDSNNASFITQGKISYLPKMLLLNPKLDLGYLRRDSNSFSFNSLNSATENYELSNIPVYDSLKQDVLEASLSFSLRDYLSQSFYFSYKDIETGYRQKLLRFNSRLNQSKYFPSLDWYGVLSSQTYQDSINTDSQIQYHALGLEWKYADFITRTNAAYRLTLFDDVPGDGSTVQGTENLKLTPSLSFSNNITYGTDLSFTKERFSSKKDYIWKSDQTSDTYQLVQFLNYPNHTLNINGSHRIVNNLASTSLAHAEVKNQYDILDFKSSHKLWDNTFSVLTSYQLNQLEFFPRLKVLEYAGTGLGQYDSTGVLVDNGDYEYIYITGSAGQLTSDLNSSLNLFYHLSPRYLPGSFLHKIKFDSNIQASLESNDLNRLSDYLSFTDRLFSSDSTKYGKRFMHNTIWIDLWKNVMNCNINYEQSYVSDKRYQEESINRSKAADINLDIRLKPGYQSRTSCTFNKEEDTKYNTVVTSNEFSELVSRILRQGLSSQVTLSYKFEKGRKNTQDLPYELRSIRFSPGITTFFSTKYRLTSNLLCQYNKRSGSDLLSFLPDKRNGFIFNTTTQLQYKFNSFTSGSFQYTGKSYPHEVFQHELRMEFRAEL